MTQAMRVLALSLGVRQTNTVDRLRAVAAQGVFTPEEAEELRGAYEVVCRIRLQGQLGALDAGRAPDSFVVPAALGKLDRTLLREAFKTLRWLERRVADRFQTAMMA
jgi:CBS domain-containing protein